MRAYKIIQVQLCIFTWRIRSFVLRFWNNQKLYVVLEEKPNQCTHSYLHLRLRTRFWVGMQEQIRLQGNTHTLTVMTKKCCIAQKFGQIEYFSQIEYRRAQGQG